MRRRRPLRAALVTASLAAAFTAPASLNSQAMALAPCSTASVLPGSNFEIDTDANLKVDGASPCIDWLSGGLGNSMRTGVLVKPDMPSGPNDDAFGQGADENDPDPTIVFGSIPPNKSDLTNFGVFTETNTSPKFLELFWTRQNVPSGTTNMDFELNQKFCDPNATPTNCADNGPNATETPLRTPGDKLITYDLAKGGTVPTISIRTWSGSVWGLPSIISGGVNPNALGSVNTSTIPANQSGGLGAKDPFTFGEAAISFNALFPPGSSCETFGSAYVKSRASNSFPAELKDFIAPAKVTISNCTGLTTNATASATLGDPISDTATLSGATSNAGGTITFNLFDNATCSGTPVYTNSVLVNGNGNYGSGNFTPAVAGTYYWTAGYSGDANNSPSQTSCGDPNETSVISKAAANIATEQKFFPQDEATVTSVSGGQPTGTVTFKLFGPSDPTCSGSPVYPAETVNLVGGSASTSNNTFSVDAANDGVYKWLVTYSGDATHDTATSACGTENATITVNNS
ncbi:hypothetical protein SAMN02787144_102133 [Streptomyces atratus]|uniref:Ig-like domain repeat protein n=2 Tax=Streptomyces atratus TaxID=1893 RepID=A0A1K2EQZ1_STRAR|nr:hypothetical protein SAMN02787144_102133 [Streptomyces atratus]